MSIQPRYDASFLAVNDELTITIMQKKNKNELYEFLKRGFEARWNEAKAIILTRPRPRPAVPRPRQGFLASRPRP